MVFSTDRPDVRSVAGLRYRIGVFGVGSAIRRAYCKLPKAMRFCDSNTARPAPRLEAGAHNKSLKPTP